MKAHEAVIHIITYINKFIEYLPPNVGNIYNNKELTYVQERYKGRVEYMMNLQMAYIFRNNKASDIYSIDDYKNLIELAVSFD